MLLVKVMQNLAKEFLKIVVVLFQIDLASLLNYSK